MYIYIPTEPQYRADAEWATLLDYGYPDAINMITQRLVAEGKLRREWIEM